MKLKFSILNAVAFAVLGLCIYLWGPGWNGYVRTAGSLLLYLAAFGACFVVVRR